MDNGSQIVIVGPTASGKTGLSIDLAAKFKGQIISADSRAIYKDLDIGTAKPSLEERKGIVHYGLDLVYPDQRFSSMKFKKYTKEKVKKIQNEGKMPIIVGGSGLYIDSYLFDYHPPAVDKRKINKYENLTTEELQNIIRSKKYIMPKNDKNKLHLINAILRQGKIPQKNDQPISGSLIIGLSPSKESLRSAIKSRADCMFETGVIEEAELAFKKYGYSAPGLKGGIYAELVSYFQGKTDLNTVKENFIKSDLNLAKRQMTWFKRNKYIKWFESANEAKNFMGLLN
jgi:tRNA dimethylallyltransferase